ncbi:unnamed protein product [Cladocopium goreaui]|uniref:Uncharacterized protein sll0005 n=1 Tax=Cladocopium goreaui TaxID=2562237 RepID=A0A9P1FW01_9DINO|nr:unnamed protein product [Cladocopium goreaui]
MARNEKGSKHSVMTSPGGTLMNFRSSTKTRRFDKEMGAIEKDRLCQVLKKDVRGNAKQFWDALKSASLQHFESTDAVFMAFSSPSDCMMSLEQFQELSEYLGFALTYHSAKTLFEQKLRDREMNAMTLEDFQDACIVAPLDRIRARLRGHRQNMLACAFHIDNFIRHLSLFTGEDHRRRAVTRFQQKLTTRFCVTLWSSLQQWAERKTLAGEPMISKETFLKLVDSIQSFQAFEMDFFGNIYERVDRGQKGEVVMFDLTVTILLMATSNSRCDKAKLIFTVFDTDGDGCLSSEQQRENQRGMAAMASPFASPVSVASAGRSATGATGATCATLASRGAGGVAVADETGWHPKLAATAALAVTFSLGKRGRRAAVRPKVLCRATNIFERSSLEAGAKLLEEAVKSSNGFTSFSEEKNRQSYVSQQAALEGLEDWRRETTVGCFSWLEDVNGVDDDGLPLVYSVEREVLTEDTKPGELGERWSRFLRISTPFITRFFYSLLNGRLWEDEASLASQAVDNMQELGPTFVKLGQVLSIRPDVLPPKTMKELARLQDAAIRTKMEDDIETFSNEEARKVIEKEMGKPVDEIFSSFSEEPIAAASLAQVYRATLRETGQEVAVKVQRPGALSTVSKDLYVLRRLADVVQPLIRRFTADETDPRRRTRQGKRDDYIALTETFAEGLYTELDFRNEALNALRMEELLKESLGESSLEKIIIPRPLMPFTTRRVMLSQWVNGVKLSTLPKEEIKELIAIGQEVFLTQLLDIGFFHGDPHPGNLLKITEGEDAGKLCLLDFGLVAQVPRKDRDIIVSAVVHLGTQNWEALIEDFQELGFLSEDTDKDALIPIMQRVLKPYLKGGGAQAFKNANFQALTQDLLKVNMEVKFSIPPYVSLLARSVATLEGVALQGDPGYQIVAMAYPFVIRRLLKNDSRLSFSALRELLYDPHTRRMRPQRLATMLQASLGVVADADSREGFIDFDSVPKDSAPVSEVVKFLLSPNASKLRPLLNAELAYGLDLVLRRTARRARSTLRDVLAPRVPVVGIRLPQPPLPPLLLPVPRDLQKTGPEAFQNGVDLISIEEVFEGVFPELNTSEARDVDFDTFNDAAKSIFNNGDELPEVSPQTLLALLRAVVQREDCGVPP